MKLKVIIDCVASSTCHGHGTCDPSTGACNCGLGWDGPVCDQCAQYYYGGSCDKCMLLFFSIRVSSAISCIYSRISTRFFRTYRFLDSVYIPSYFASRILQIAILRAPALARERAIPTEIASAVETMQAHPALFVNQDTTALLVIHV